MTIASHLAPFIAWLATREPDAALRRRYCEYVESYLTFAARAGGPSEQARRRSEAELPPAAPAQAEQVTAPARFTEYQTINEQTRIPPWPGDGQPVERIRSPHAITGSHDRDAKPAPALPTSTEGGNAMFRRLRTLFGRPRPVEDVQPDAHTARAREPGAEVREQQ